MLVSVGMCGAFVLTSVDPSPFHQPFFPRPNLMAITKCVGSLINLKNSLKCNHNVLD